MSNPLLDTSSLPQFAEIAPEHVLPALKQVISAHRSKLGELLDNTADPDFESLVAPLEDMEHELSRVWSPVSHLQGVLGSREWREAYNAALPILTEYGTELSQNARLQRAYARVDGGLPADASEEGRDLFADFCMGLLEPLRAPADLPPEYLNDRGEYRWARSSLMRRAAKQGALSATSRHFNAPSRDFALIARKLTGVFTFIDVLEAEFNAYEMVESHIRRWREREGLGKR